MIFAFLQSPTQVQPEGKDSGPARKPKIAWSDEMHEHFVNVVDSLGGIDGEPLEPCKVLLGCGTLLVESVILSSFLSAFSPSMQKQLQNVSQVSLGQFSSRQLRAMQDNCVHQIRCGITCIAPAKLIVIRTSFCT